MKKLNHFKRKVRFEPVSKVAFKRLGNGFYLLKAETGTPYSESTTKEIDELLFLSISFEYYLFEINNNLKDDENESQNIFIYHQLYIRNLSIEEYNEYMELEN